MARSAGVIDDLPSHAKHVQLRMGYLVFPNNIATNRLFAFPQAHGFVDHYSRALPLLSLRVFTLSPMSEHPSRLVAYTLSDMQQTLLGNGCQRLIN